MPPKKKTQRTKSNPTTLVAKKNTASKKRKGRLPTAEPMHANPLYSEVMLRLHYDPDERKREDKKRSSILARYPTASELGQIVASISGRDGINELDNLERAFNIWIRCKNFLYSKACSEAMEETKNELEEEIESKKHSGISLKDPPNGFPVSLPEFLQRMVGNKSKEYSLNKLRSYLDKEGEHLRGRGFDDLADGLIDGFIGYHTREGFDEEQYEVFGKPFKKFLNSRKGGKKFKKNNLTRPSLR